jgi:hypothetical protein
VQCIIQATADAQQRYFARIILLCSVYLVQTASLLEVARVHSSPEAGAFLVVGLSLIVGFDAASIVLAALPRPPHVRIAAIQVGLCSLTLYRRSSRLYLDGCRQALQRAFNCPSQCCLCGGHDWKSRPLRSFVGSLRSLPSLTYCETRRLANSMYQSMTDDIQEHRTVLDLGDHTTRKGGHRAGMPGIPAGALELAASFLATDACTDTYGPRRSVEGFLEPCELAMAVTRTLAR